MLNPLFCVGLTIYLFRSAGEDAGGKSIEAASGGENFLPKVLSDEPPGPFREGHFIGETAFEKHPNRRMVKLVGGCDQSNVLADSQVHQPAGFRENEHFAYERRLDFL